MYSDSLLHNGTSVDDMKRKGRIWKKLMVVLGLVMALVMGGCQSSDVVIVYDNDVHCTVDGYAKLAAVQNAYRKETPYVTTVSCGDFVQGDVIGSVSRGASIVDIMNRVGYDVVTLGNHEFDFGVPHLFALTDSLKAEVVDANFRDLKAGRFPFSPYTIKQYGDIDIAYLGLTTPATLSLVAYTTFIDEETGDVCYDFCQEDFYGNAQRFVDEARREGADYVVVLSHLGDSGMSGVSSVELIQHTTGIDVVLDGHDHHVIPDTTIFNGEGRPVLLSSTGSSFRNIGVLTLSADGKFTSMLLATDTCQSVDKEVDDYVHQVKEQVLAQGDKVIGKSDILLDIMDAEGHRIVRNQEAPIGNFFADALRHVSGTDIALVNGGGIRASIPKGDVTFNTLLAVSPYHNDICMATMSGKQIMDALEVSARALPFEHGGFLQVSGIRFQVDTSIETSVQFDDNGQFTHVAGARRVSQVEVWDKAQGKYLPIIPQRIYTISSFGYLIEQGGEAGILRRSKLIKNNMGKDVDFLSIYIRQMLNGCIGEAYNQLEGRIRIGT